MAQIQAASRASTPVSRRQRADKGQKATSEAEKQERKKEWRTFINSWPADSLSALRCCAVTAFIYCLCLYLVVKYPNPLTAFLMGGSIVRTFVLFHDCCHGALFPGGAGSQCNRMVANLCEPFIGRSAAVWSASHNKHHRILGSEPPPKEFPPQDGPDHDDSRTVLFSVQQYESYPLWKKCMARVMRDPFVFYGMVVPLNWVVVVFEIRARLLGFAWNYAIASYFGTHVWKHFLVGQWLALVMAGLLFHLQHQVNPGYWKDHDHGYDFEDAVSEGCSFLQVPFFLRWITLGIEYHHIHHYSIKVPCYRLAECHEAWKESDFVESVTIVSMSKALRSSFHAMWDEVTEEYVSFPFYRALGLEDRVKTN